MDDFPSHDFHVGDSIRARPGSWTFSALNGDDFDEHIAKSIPSYHNIHLLSSLLSSHFISPGSTCYDIGCSTGTFLRRLHSFYKDRNIKLIGIDCEESMVAAAQSQDTNRCARYIKSDILCFDFEPSSCIYSNFTLQFIPPDARIILISKIYSSLRKGGGFFLYEKVLEADSRIHEITSKAYTAFKLQNFSASEIVAKSQSLDSILNPNTRSENIELLHESGFNTVSLIYKTLCFEGYLAIK